MEEKLEVELLISSINVEPFKVHVAGFVLSKSICELTHPLPLVLWFITIVVGLGGAAPVSEPEFSRVPGEYNGAEPPVLEIANEAPLFALPPLPPSPPAPARPPSPATPALSHA